MYIQQSAIMLGDQQNNKIDYEALALFVYNLYQLHQLVKDIAIWILRQEERRNHFTSVHFHTQTGGGGRSLSILHFPKA